MSASRARLVVLMPTTACLYMLWMNASVQDPMGYWLKSFNNKTNPPVPGVTFSVAQINVCECITSHAAVA